MDIKTTGHFTPLPKAKLDTHSTMQTGGPAEAFATVKSRAVLLAAYEWANHHRKQVRIIGSGSNILWSDGGFCGHVLENQITAFDADHSDQVSCVVTIGSGELLDSVVERSVHLGLSGIECLSMNPGTIGGAITQDSGAYGQEIANTLISVDVYDREHRIFRTLADQASQLAYRTSTFKKPPHQRFAILETSLKLKVRSTVHVRYPALISALRHQPTATPAELRRVVQTIRTAKLPNVACTPNCGSFFVNPLVDRTSFEARLKALDPPFQAGESDSIKVPAAWRIEQCGLRGHRVDTLGFGTWPKQAVCIVTSTENLMRYRDVIGQAVWGRFAIRLQQEPEMLG